MSRLRSSMILLGICIAAIVIGGLRLLTDSSSLPVGSSYSAQPDGAQALYEWTGALGASPYRLKDTSLLDGQTPATLLVLQPETPLDPAARTAFDAVPRDAGTLDGAGDSLAWLLYVRSLGVTVEPVRNSAARVSTPDGGLSLDLTYRFRVQADDATPLLVASNGDWVALRMPYEHGSLVVLATPMPLTNAGLADGPTARFVYREIIPPATPAPVGTLAFDEVHHSFAPPTVGPTTLNQLAFDTPVGRAIIYGSGLVFLFLLLGGRRLGPAVPAPAATATRRTMYEHVQMLANLYRRAGQLSVARSAFARQYQRELARGVVGSPKRAVALTHALARVEGARNEAELIAAVAAAQDA